MTSDARIRDAASLADILKGRRREIGVRQDELAGMNGISRQAVIDAESGRGDPKLSTLVTLLEGMGLQLVAVPSSIADRLVMSAGAAPSSGDFGDEGIDGGDWSLDAGIR